MMFGKALVMGKLNYYLPLLSAERSTGTLRCLDVALNDFMRVMTGLIQDHSGATAALLFGNPNSGHSDS